MKAKRRILALLSLLASATGLFAANHVVQVGEKNGVKFPREFGLLLKQILYFDRYVRLLAPEIEVVSDERVAFMDSAALQSKDRTMT